MIFPSDNKVEDKLYDYLYQVNEAGLHLDQYYSGSEVEYIVMWINNQGQRHVQPFNTTEQDTDYEHYSRLLVLIPTCSVKYIFKATTQLVSNFICLPLWRHLNYYFT